MSVPKRIIVSAVLVAGLSLSLSLPVLAAAQNAPVGQCSMTLFPVERGADGAQYAITPAGMKVMLPGFGISPEANQIAVYRDDQNNYWYINAKGQPTRVTHDQIQWTRAQVQAQVEQRLQNGQGMPYMPFVQGAPGMPPQGAMAPQQQPVNQTVVVNQPPAQQSSGSSSGSSGSSALASGLAAAGGSLAGAAIGSAFYNNNPSYYGIPYGTPMWHEGNNMYYVAPNGNRVYVNNNANHAYYNNQWNQQSTWENAQNKWNSMSPNQQAATYNAHQVNKDNREQASTPANGLGAANANGGRFGQGRFGGGADAGAADGGRFGGGRMGRLGGRRR